jgi:hypothetical protein
VSKYTSARAVCVAAGRKGADQAAPGRPQGRPASVPEVTVDAGGVVVVLGPPRRRRCVRRPLPSDAGSSPKDTQLSEQTCASKQLCNYVHHICFVCFISILFSSSPVNLHHPTVNHSQRG